MPVTLFDARHHAVSRLGVVRDISCEATNVVAGAERDFENAGVVFVTDL